MARIEFSPEVLHDLDQIFDHLQRYKIDDAPSRTQEAIHAIDALEHNPLIGRPEGNGKRELVIGRDARGYVALYSYVAEMDAVFVLAIRSQKEAGYIQP